jgi:hypothetical protein
MLANKQRMRQSILPTGRFWPGGQIAEEIIDIFVSLSFNRKNQS